MQPTAVGGSLPAFLFRYETSNEAGLVRLDHEAILINAAIRVVDTIAASFLKLLALRNLRVSE
jgi:hypothetical protein